MSVPSWSDTLDAVDNAYGDVSIGQHKRMCAALNSSSRLVGLPRVHGDSLRQLSIKDSSGAYSIELQLDPEATIMCSCADYTWSHFICKHICWLLIRVGGQLDWCLFSLGRDNGCCWTASLRRLAANLDNPVLQREALLPNRHIHVDVTVANPADDCRLKAYNKELDSGHACGAAMPVRAEHRCGRCAKSHRALPVQEAARRAQIQGIHLPTA